MSGKFVELDPNEFRRDAAGSAEIPPKSPQKTQSGTQGMSRRRLLAIAAASLFGTIALERLSVGIRQIADPAPKPTATPKEITPASVERAQEVLGERFLGPQAISVMESKIKDLGVNVKFNLDPPPVFPYSEADLQAAYSNGEILFLRAGEMNMNGIQTPITLENFRNLHSLHPKGIDLFRSLKPADKGDWFRAEPFFRDVGQIHLGWSLVKRDSLEGVTYFLQANAINVYRDKLISQGATNVNIIRRTAAEVTWDWLVYYYNNNTTLLQPGRYDWTSTGTAFGYMVAAGMYPSGPLNRPSLGIDYLVGHPRGENRSFQVFPTR